MSGKTALLSLIYDSWVFVIDNKLSSLLRMTLVIGGQPAGKIESIQSKQITFTAGENTFLQ